MTSHICIYTRVVKPLNHSSLVANDSNFRNWSFRIRNIFFIDVYHSIVYINLYEQLMASKQFKCFVLFHETLQLFFLTFFVFLDFDDFAVIALLLLLPALLVDQDLPGLVPGLVHELQQLFILIRKQFSASFSFFCQKSIKSVNIKLGIIAIGNCRNQAFMQGT